MNLQRRAWIPYIVLTGTLLLTALSTYYAATIARQEDRLRFENAVQQTQDQIQNRLDTYITLLRSGTGLFAAKGEVSRQEFQSYVGRLRLENYYPGIQGIGYSVRLSPAQVPTLVAQMHRQGRPDFAIKPALPRREIHTILYLEPLDRRNRTAIGYDMFTEAKRRAAMERARDTGQAAASGRVTLVQEIDAQKQAGFLVYLPIYRGGTIPATIAARRAELQGFVYSPFRADDLLNSITTASQGRWINVQIYDGVSPQPAQLLHSSPSGPPTGRKHASRLATSRTLEVAGRPWTLVFSSRPELEKSLETRQVPYILGGGLLLSMLLFWMTLSQVKAYQAIATVAAELRQSETALRASEIRFRTLVEQSPLSIQILALDGHTLQVNRAWEQLWGVSADHVQPYNILKDAQLQTSGVMDSIQKAFAGASSIVPPILYDPGKSVPPGVVAAPPRWVQAHIYPVKDAAGVVREVVVMHEDITQRQESELALQRANTRLGFLYNLSSHLLLHEQPKAFISTLCHQVAVHLNLEVYFLYLLEDNCHTSTSADLRQPAAQGQELHLHTYCGISELLAAQLQHLDLGDTVSGRVALNRQSMVLDNVQRSQTSIDRLIRIIGINAYACYPLMAGERLLGTFAFGTRNRPQFTDDELSLMQVVCDQVATALERSRLLTELQHQTAELAQSNRMKDQFLSVLSHELRTPLNSILGWLTLMGKRQMPPEKVASALETIDRNTRLLAQLIDDLLDVSRIITGKLPLQLREVSLQPILETAIETVRPTAETKSIQLITQIQPEPATLMGDPTRLQQVFTNLLTNAIKFTPNGGRVEVKLERQAGEGKRLERQEDQGRGQKARERQEGNGKGQQGSDLPSSASTEPSTVAPQPSAFSPFSSPSAIITVADTGQGIPAEVLPFIFDRFRQADSSTTRTHGGLGLGLAIVRYLVEQHGGTVQAESPGIDQGATFTIKLPLLPGFLEPLRTSQPEPSWLLERGNSQSLVGLRVLLVDDEADARELVGLILSQAGAVVTPTASSQEALENLQRSCPDLLISDIGMPGEDGYMLIQQVRNLPASQGGRIPAIALTAYARPEDRQRAIAAGFQYHLAKPVDPTQLIQTAAHFSDRP